MDFNDLDVKELDKDLSDNEREEWNAIYASYRSGSIMTDRIVGTDLTTVTVHNKETGEPEKMDVLCLVVIAYRVKILIPEQEIWYSEKTSRPPHVIRSMSGAITDYVITAIDRENGCCIASRRLALQIRRRAFEKLPPKEDSKITINIMAVGAAHLLANFAGFDITLTQRDLSYGMLGDLRETYHPGETYKAVYKSYDAEKETLRFSVKETEPHPFEGAETRHPLGCRRASTISGKYKGGVFCKLEENLDSLCTYSQYGTDADFKVGDRVIVIITKYDYQRKLVYGKIVAKW